MVGAPLPPPVHDTVDAADVPFPVEPVFRMRPGLAPCGEPLSDPDAGAPAAARAVAQARALGRLPLCTDDPRLPSALVAAGQRLGVSAGNHTAVAAANALRDAIQDDFALMLADDDGSVLRAAALAIAMPSHWRPADKIGQALEAIHAPVADARTLNDAWPTLARRMISGGPLRRHVWTLADGAELSRHPDDLEAGGALADEGALWFRAERQTIVPLPAVRACLFLIRVHVADLEAVLRVAPDRRATLLAALDSMSDAVLAYKGLAGIRARLRRT